MDLITLANPAAKHITPQRLDRYSIVTGPFFIRATEVEERD